MITAHETKSGDDSPVAGSAFKYKLIILFRILFVFFAVHQLFPDHFYIVEKGGLDPSWKMALDMAFRTGLRWGSDFVFTYGPLGFLSARLPTPEFAFAYLTSDIFVTTQLALLAYCLSRLISGPIQLIAAIGMVLLFGWSPYYIELALLVAVLLFFCLLKFIQEKRNFWLVFAALDAVMVFYVKLNVGLFGMLFFIGALAVCFLEHRQWRPVLFGLVLLLFFWLASLLVLPVSLPGYIRQSWQIASGFNENMGVFSSDREPFLFLASAVLLAWGLILMANVGTILKSPSQAFLFGGSSILLFVVFKQGFVRADGHELSFFTFAPLIVALAGIFGKIADTRWLRQTLALAIGCSMPIWHPHLTSSFYSGQLGGFSEYVQEAKNLLSLSINHQNFPVDTPGENLIPDDLRQQIGSAGVDVLPWEISLVYYNHLTYNPRPIMQSYSAYTPGLLAANEAKYQSPSAPDYVFVSSPCIDSRFCQAEDIGARKALLERYSLIRKEHGHLVLKKGETNRVKTDVPLTAGAARAGEWIQIPEGEGLTFLKADIKYSLAGLLRLVFYRAPEIRIVLKMKDGSTREQRAVRGNLLYGIPISRWFSSNQQLERFHKGRWHRLPRIEAFQIYAPAAYGIKDSYQYSLSDYMVRFSKQDSEL